MERRPHMVAIGNDGGRMFDSVRYRMYATEDDVILDGTMARIKLEYRAGDIAYGVDLPQPFDMGLVEDEAMKFDPGKPVGMPPVWLIVCGEATPRTGLLALTWTVTALDREDWQGNVHAAVETGYPNDISEDVLNGARFALWALCDLLEPGRMGGKERGDNG